jgi:hypothetical protein
MTMDELGNISKVTELNPAGGTWDTNYRYTLLGQLLDVSQTRGGTTQTRSFTYTGALVASSTTPEQGTTTYTYSGVRLDNKIDAKNQKTKLYCDSLGRVTKKEVQYFYTAGGYHTPDPCATVEYWWDDYYASNSGYGQENLTGRLSAVEYRNCGSGSYAPPASSTSHRVELYSYTPAGQAKFKRFYRGVPGYGAASLQSDLTYDSEGRLATLHYPNTSSGTGATYTYTYDSVSGRSTGMNVGGTPVVSNLTYGPAGELLTMTYGSYNEARSYNTMYQLTRLTDTPTGGGGATIDFEYSFSSSANNGKITKMKDWVTGEEVNYAYDALNRLLSAETTGAGWGQSYGF